MKYTTEQIKDLLLLSNHGCWGRSCFNCMWDRTKICALLKIEGYAGISPKIKKRAKELIREML